MLGKIEKTIIWCKVTWDSQSGAFITKEKIEVTVLKLSIVCIIYICELYRLILKGQLLIGWFLVGLIVVFFLVVIIFCHRLRTFGPDVSFLTTIVASWFFFRSVVRCEDSLLLPCCENTTPDDSGNATFGFHCLYSLSNW